MKIKTTRTTIWQWLTKRIMPTTIKEVQQTEKTVPVIQTIITAIESLHCNYTTEHCSEEYAQFKIVMSARNSSIESVTQIYIANNTIRISYWLPIRYPSHKMAQMLDLIARINEKLFYGNFSIDADKRLLSFWITFPVSRLDFGLGSTYQSMLNIGFETFDVYTPAVLKVAYGNTIPQQALLEMENQIDPTLN